MHLIGFTIEIRLLSVTFESPFKLTFTFYPMCMCTNSQATSAGRTVALCEPCCCHPCTKLVFIPYD